MKYDKLISLENIVNILNQIKEIKYIIRITIDKKCFS
jgi:hypothetical protein